MLKTFHGPGPGGSQLQMRPEPDTPMRGNALERNFSGAERAAVLMQSLDQENALKIARMLSISEIHAIRSALALLGPIEAVASA